MATYDALHVPPSALADFWALVRRCLTPGGRVAFVDEDDRGAGHDDVQAIDGIPAARRRLSDGQQFEIVKVFWRPDDLERRLQARITSPTSPTSPSLHGATMTHARRFSTARCT